MSLGSPFWIIEEDEEYASVPGYSIEDVWIDYYDSRTGEDADLFCVFRTDGEEWWEQELIFIFNMTKN